MGTLSGKVAIITGASASQGIGAAIAHRFARDGAALYLSADGDPGALESLAEECRALGGESAYGVFDLAEAGGAEAMVAQALDGFGRVDVLVNNAATRAHAPFGAYSRDDFDRVVAVNLAAPFFASQAVLPTMRGQGGGRIIHVASQVGMVAIENGALYGLTKAALIYLARAMAYELAHDGILVNAISPGPVRTGRNAERFGQDSQEAQRWLAQVPAGRFGRPDEIAEVAFFLATTEAAFLQGDNIVVDGGYTAH